MSRSYHVTRKSVKNARKIASCNSNPVFMEECENLEKQYADKRRTKRYIRDERKDPVLQQRMDSVDTLPIEVVDHSRYLHYPVKEQDIRAILRQMPQGLTDGLSKITFCLGKHQQTLPEETLYAEPPRDPFFNRIGYPVFNEIYRPRCLGAYFRARREIKIYGYVYHPSIKDKQFLEFYLRLHMLCTFIHELAHHFDFSQRVARGRWCMDDRNKVETYAENMAYEWTRDYLIPYIQKYYCVEYKKASQWMKKYIGVVLDLSMLTGECRAIAMNDSTRFIFYNTSEYFEEFVGEIRSGKDLIQSRIALADGLHKAEEYQIALKILHPILKEYPENIEAILVYVDILNHLGKYKEAIKLSKKVLQLNEDDVYALFHLSTSYEYLGEWDKVLKIACRGLRLNSDWYRSFYVIKARAEVKLGKLKEAKKTLEDVKKLTNWKRTPSHVREIESELKKKTGKAKV